MRVGVRVAVGIGAVDVRIVVGVCVRAARAASVACAAASAVCSTLAVEVASRSAVGGACVTGAGLAERTYTTKPMAPMNPSPSITNQGLSFFAGAG